MSFYVQPAFRAPTPSPFLNIPVNTPFLVTAAFVGLVFYVFWYSAPGPKPTKKPTTTNKPTPSSTIFDKKPLNDLSFLTGQSGPPMIVINELSASIEDDYILMTDSSDSALLQPESGDFLSQLKPDDVGALDIISERPTDAGPVRADICNRSARSPLESYSKRFCDAEGMINLSILGKEAIASRTIEATTSATHKQTLRVKDRDTGDTYTLVSPYRGRSDKIVTAIKGISAREGAYWLRKRG